MFNLFASTRFYLQIPIFVVLYRMLARFVPMRIMHWILLLISYAFLHKLGESKDFFYLTAAYTVFVIGLAHVVRLDRVRKSRFAGPVSVALVLSVLYYFKYNPRHPAIEWVGLSYMTLRALDLVLMARTGRLKSMAFAPLALYLSFFGTFVSGPIDRYLPFVKQLEARPLPLSFEQFRESAFRISTGVIKSLFLAKMAYQYSILPMLEPGGQAPTSLGALALSLYSFLLYEYFDFSGYCDCAIGISAFFGIKVMENFNFPLISKSIQEFWNRWHISLSTWCRDHIFFSLNKKLQKRFPEQPAILFGLVSIFTTFVILGMWHGSTLNWLIYSISVGLALSVWMAWRYFMETYKPKLYDRLCRSAVYKTVCCIATLNYVSFNLLLSLRLDQLAVIGKALGIGGGA